MSYEKTYTYKILLFLDLFACALFFRDPDVTISSETALYLRRDKPPMWARVLNKALNWIQPNHCELAVKADIERATRAIAYLSQSSK